MAKWLSSLEKKLEQHSEGSHRDFRVFISAEPAPCPESHIIPQGILESSIKITNEPPTGMHANLHKALDNFNQVGAVLLGRLGAWWVLGSCSGTWGDLAKPFSSQCPQTPQALLCSPDLFPFSNGGLGRSWPAFFLQEVTACWISAQFVHLSFMYDS